jgi:hypothetical protein
MSWGPTFRIARTAWRGRRDPAGLIKSQLSDDPAPESAVQLPKAPVEGSVPHVQPAVMEPAATLASVEGDATETQLLLLLR